MNRNYLSIKCKIAREHNLLDTYVFVTCTHTFVSVYASCLQIYAILYFFVYKKYAILKD